MRRSPCIRSTLNQQRRAEVCVMEIGQLGADTDLQKPMWHTPKEVSLVPIAELLFL